METLDSTLYLSNDDLFLFAPTPPSRTTARAAITLPSGPPTCRAFT